MSPCIHPIACILAVVLTLSCAAEESRPPQAAPAAPPSGGIGLGKAPPGSATTTTEGLGLTGAMYGDSIGAAVDPSRVKGRLPPEVIQRIVRANFPAIKNCYDEGLLRNPKLEGKVSTRFVIERDGHVSQAADVHDSSSTDPLEGSLGHPAEGARFPDAKVVACVVAKFAALTFPEPQGGIVTVVYPVIFNHDE